MAIISSSVSSPATALIGFVEMRFRVPGCMSCSDAPGSWGSGPPAPEPGPCRVRSAPWHIQHGVVLPVPMVTSLTPFFTLPTGAYTMIPEWKSRKTSVASVSCGVDPPSFHCLRRSGTCRRRCTSSEPWRFRPPSSKASASWSRVLPGLSGLQSLGEDDHPVGVGFARVRALGMRSRKSIIVWME